MDVGVHVDNDQPPSVSVLNALRKACDLYDFIMHIVSKLFICIFNKGCFDFVRSKYTTDSDNIILGC